MTKHAIQVIRFLLLGTCVIPGGCTVGPDFERPDVSAPQAWTSLDAEARGPGVTSVPSAEAADVTQWWREFNDSVLTSLVERAAEGNLSLAQAASRIRQARAAETIAASGLFPSISADASYDRARVPITSGSHTSGVTSSFYRAGFDATWEIDVFGGIRRGVEGAEAQIDSAYFDQESILVSLTAEVASTYLDLRGAQRQLAIAQENLASQRDSLQVTQDRFDAGFVSSLDVANAQAQVSLTESQIPAFDAQARASIYALGVLLGQEPGALLEELSVEAPPPRAPGAVPVGLPSELLERRPDIRKAEADLHAATASVGVAVADQYPKFSLTGSFGTQGDQVTSLGSIANQFWSIGPAVSLPLFTGGRIQGNIEQAEAVAEQAKLAYRAAILTALQDVETSLVNFTREQQRQVSLSESVAANRTAVEVALELYSGGRTDFLNVLTAQGRLYATQAALVQSETTVGTNLVALYKALGGGWDVSKGASAAGQPPGQSSSAAGQ